MATFSQIANAYRVALILDAIDTSDLIAWADSEIEASTIPPNALVDVSMGRKLPTAAMISHLTELADDENDSWSIQRGMSYVASCVRNGTMTIESAIMGCYRFLQSENLLYDDEFIMFVTYEDELSLIRDGIFGDDHLAQLRIDFLESLDEMANRTGNAG